MQIVFEKTWNITLSEQQKQTFIQQFSKITQTKAEFTAHPIRIKRKRNGGIVATVFLQNHHQTAWLLRQASIHLVNEFGDRVASTTLTLSLDIPPRSAMPWSFIFPPEHITSDEEPRQQWTLDIH